MKKISMLLAVIMLISTLYIPAYASIGATDGFIDEGQVPYFNSFTSADGVIDSTNQLGELTTNLSGTVENGYLNLSVTAGSSALEGSIYFEPTYTNTSESKQPLVLEYKVKFDAKAGHSTSHYLSHYAKTDGTSSETYGIKFFPKQGSSPYYPYVAFSNKDSEKIKLSGEITNWHTISIVYSSTDNTKELYWDGTFVAKSTPTSAVAENYWDDLGKLGRVRLVLYAAKNRTMRTYMDYLKLYEKPSVFGAQVLNVADGELDEIFLDFNSTVMTLTEDDLTVDEKKPANVELYDEEKQIYKVTLSEKLKAETEYKLSLGNVSNMVGQSVSGDISFKTRKPKQLYYDISPVSGTNIVTGENKFDVTYINETETSVTHDLVVAQFDKDNIMINSEKIPVTMEAQNDTSTKAKVTLTDDVKSVQMFVMGTDGKTNYSGAYLFKREGEPEKEEFIDLITDTEPSYSYKVLDTTNEVSIEIENENEGIANIILTDANSKVVYTGQHNTSDKKANFVFRIKESGTYTLSYKMNSNSKWYEDSIKYYSGEYIDTRFDEFNTTANINVIAGYLAEFEEVLGLNTDKLNLINPEEDKKLIYTSLLSQRNELENKKFADTDAVNTALDNAYLMYDLYKGSKKASEVAKDLADATFYNFMDVNYSDELIKYIDGGFSGKMYNTKSEFNKAFCESVVLSGVYKGENFSLTTKIISELAGYIPLDLTTYAKLVNPSNADIELSGKSYANLSKFIAAFDSIVKNQYDDENTVAVLPPPSPGISFSGGGGGGGGSTGRPSQEITPPEETTPPEEITPPETTEPQEKFTDLSGFDWAKDAINNLADKGIVNGVTEESYNPSGSVKREEFVKMIDALYTANAEASEFSDVNQNEWYAPFINKAVSAGIVKGMSDSIFGLGKGVTREDMAVMILRALKLEITTDNEVFSDDSEISSYAKDAVYTLKNKGIISGTGNGNFEPKRIMTRAEAAVLINNILNAID